MKKAVTLIIALLFAAGAFAQNNPSKDRLDEIENLPIPDALRKIKHRHDGFERFDFTMLSHLNFGLHSMRGEGFKSSLGPSWQIQMNVMRFRFAPTSWLGLEAGWDLSWDRFRIAQGYRILKEDRDLPTKGQVVLRPTEPTIPGLTGRQTFRLFSFTFPVLAHFQAGPVGIRTGVELGVPLGGRIAGHYKESDTVTDTLVKGLEHGKFFYAIMAQVDYEGLGIYCKYCPQPFIPGLDFRYWCWGITLGLD